MFESLAFLSLLNATLTSYLIYSCLSLSTSFFMATHLNLMPCLRYKCHSAPPEMVLSGNLEVKRLARSSRLLPAHRLKVELAVKKRMCFDSKHFEGFFG